MPSSASLCSRANLGKRAAAFAQIHEERLFDSGAALRNLEQAGALHGLAKLDERESPWPALVRLYGESQRFADAAEAADRLVSSLADETSPAARSEAIVQSSTRSTRCYGRHGNEPRRSVCR